MRFHSYKKNKINTFLGRTFIIIIISFIFSIFIIKYLSNKSEIILMPLAESKVRKIITTVINNSTKDIKFEKNLISIDKDNNNEIKMVRYNTYEVTKLINEVTDKIENELDKLYYQEDTKLNNILIEEIPIGVIFNNTFLNGLGPKIKIRSEIIGSIISNIETEVKPYGINNAYLETRISLDVTARIYLPSITKDIKIKNVIPISMNVISGTVPDGYITSYK